MKGIKGKGVGNFACIFCVSIYMCKHVCPLSIFASVGLSWLSAYAD